MQIEELAQKRILLLDGAMGTMIQRYSLTEKDFRNERLENHPKDLFGNNDLLSITRPDVISAIHRAYLEAGADILETNTFNSNSVAQADYDLEDWVYELNKQSAQLAKVEVEKFRKETDSDTGFVAGSIGPTNRTASLSPDVNDPGFRAIDFDQLVEAYEEQSRGLIDGGCDLLLVETVFDTLNAKAALFAIQNVFEEKGLKLPIMVSGTITDAAGRTLSGQTARAFLNSISHVELFSVGFNCALGAKQLLAHIDSISELCPFNISAHPNAGLPNEMGDYDETPELMTKQIEEYFERGLVNIIGGCCGTTPDHIKAIARSAKQYEPRKIAALELEE